MRYARDNVKHMRKIAHQNVKIKRIIIVGEIGGAKVLDKSHELFWRAFFPAFFEPQVPDGPPEEFLPIDTSPEGLRNWLERLCVTSGATNTQIAREAGLAPSTLNRFMKKKGGGESLSISTVQSIAYAASAMKTFGNIKARVYEPRQAEVAVVGQVGIVTNGKFQGDPRNEYRLRINRPLASHRGRLLGVRHKMWDGDPKDAATPVTLDTIYVGTTDHDLSLMRDGYRYLVHFRAGDAVTTEIRRATNDPNGRKWLLHSDPEQKAIFVPDLDATGLSDNTLISLLVLLEVRKETWVDSLDSLPIKFR